MTSKERRMKRFEIACLWTAFMLMAATVLVAGCAKAPTPPDGKSPEAKAPAEKAAPAKEAETPRRDSARAQAA